MSPDRRIAAPERVGPFWLLGALGKGGTAEVFLVTADTPVGLAKIEVLKRPRGDFDDPELVSMFIDEGRVGSRLNHPNVVRTTDVGMYAGRPHISMEYVEGQSLHRVIHDAREGRLALDAELSLFIIREVLEGLSYAHTLRDFDGSPLSIVHRDVSPGNVLLSYAGEVKLCDFGIARAALRLAQTQPGIIKGKARYMAPEQKQNGGFDHRVDIYAVGVVAWELLSGRPLSLDEVAGAPPSLIDEGADVALELDAIIMRALARDPDERFQTAEDMLEALEELTLAARLKVQRKRLSNLLMSAYESERRERRALVQRRLDQVREGRVREQLPKLHGAGDSLPPEPTSVSLRPPVSTPTSGVVSRRTAVTRGALAASLVGVMLGGIVLFIQLHESETAPASQPASLETSDASAPAPAMSVSGEPRPVELLVEVSPSDASLIFDGQPVEGPELRVVRPASSVEHRLEIVAAGYKTVERSIVLERDTVLRVSLEAVGDQPYPATIPPSARRPARGAPSVIPTPDEPYEDAPR